jgi:hypothetical protein
VRRRIVNDQSQSNPNAKDESPKLAHIKLVFVKSVTRANNRAGPVRQNRAVLEHVMRAAVHRILIKECLATR